LLAGRGERALRDPAVAGGEGDHVQPVEFVAGVAPGACGLRRVRPADRC
jgi:hypothetical protein